MKTTIITCLSVIALVFTFSFRTEKHEVNLSSNEYKVLTVQGRIIFEQSGKDMLRGDLYVTGTPLDFTTASSRAAIINDINGRYVISSNKGKLNVLPAANNVMSRSNSTILNLVDLKNHFSDRYLVIKRGEVQISSENFPMNENQFFYLTYQHNGEEIAKKLRSEGDFLILDAEEIFKIDGKPIEVTEKEMTLYYKNEKSTKVSTFTPVFPDANELKEEIAILLETYKNESNSKKINEINGFLNEFYGKPNKKSLADWLKAEFELE